MRNPRSLLAAWPRIHALAVRSSRLLLFLDFDGTLVPIRARPEEVWLAPRLRRLLRRISKQGTSIAIVSGRSLADIRRRAGLRRVWYAGAHGFFLQSPQGLRYSLLSPSQRAGMKALLRFLRAGLRSLPGIEIEPKEATVAVHYRRAAARQVRLARTLVEELFASRKDLRLMHGKKVWEILPAARIDKSTAVRFILRRLNSSRGDALLFYFGDDTTDEAVFRKMKGISVIVGRRKGTAAHFFLRSPAEVELVLKRWHELAS